MSSNNSWVGGGMVTGEGKNKAVRAKSPSRDGRALAKARGVLERCFGVSPSTRELVLHLLPYGSAA